MKIHAMVWSFDIDGVLNNYPAPWLEFIAAHIGRVFPSLEEARRQLASDTYSRLKHAYRQSDFKYQVPVNPEALETIAQLRSRGDRVYIATSRPRDRYPDMQRRSTEWLHNAGIGFDGFLEKEIGQLKEKKCLIHIDDEEDAIRPLVAGGIRCVLYRHGSVPGRSPGAIDTIPDLRLLLDKEFPTLHTDTAHQ